MPPQSRCRSGSVAMMLSQPVHQDDRMMVHRDQWVGLVVTSSWLTRTSSCWRVHWVDGWLVGWLDGRWCRIRDEPAFVVNIQQSVSQSAVPHSHTLAQCPCLVYANAECLHCNRMRAPPESVHSLGPNEI